MTDNPRHLSKHEVRVQRDLVICANGERQLWEGGKVIASMTAEEAARVINGDCYHYLLRRAGLMTTGDDE